MSASTAPYGASNVLARPTIEPVANRVWVVRGGMDYPAIALQVASGKLPRRPMNVYLIKEHDGVTMFDAGVESMAEPLKAICDRMGGLKRIVLGHAHGDHRGAAPHMGVPVYCHADAKSEAQTPGMPPYQDTGQIEKLLPRLAFPHLSRKWDGGPVKIDGTVAEGDEIAGFEARLFAGHAPGMIGLWRESDRLCLCSDTVYTLDPLTGEFGEARTPLEFANMDTRQAKESIRKLAALEPNEVWAGHADPVRGPDVVDQLERAARS
jgi:glyoxylase-like metal-dependent hydrolase (beta-lactamase superfamily II)